MLSWALGLEGSPVATSSLLLQSCVQILTSVLACAFWTAIFNCVSTCTDRGFTSRLHPSVMGRVPGHAAWDIMCALQHQIEVSCLLDMPPCSALNLSSGYSQELAACRFDGMSRLGRAWAFCGDISTFIHSNFPWGSKYVDNTYFGAYGR